MSSSEANELVVGLDTSHLHLGQILEAGEAVPAPLDALQQQTLLAEYSADQSVRLLVNRCFSIVELLLGEPGVEVDEATGVAQLGLERGDLVSQRRRFGDIGGICSLARDQIPNHQALAQDALANRTLWSVDSGDTGLAKRVTAWYEQTRLVSGRVVDLVADFAREVFIHCTD